MPIHCHHHMQQCTPAADNPLKYSGSVARLPLVGRALEALVVAETAVALPREQAAGQTRT